MKSVFATTGSTAVMAQRREPPDALDFFPTPHAAPTRSGLRGSRHHGSIPLDGRSASVNP
jgi:hypothetical protein